jgi:hypothetical protein
MITVPFFFSSPPFIVLLHGANFHLAAFDVMMMIQIQMIP